MGCSTTYVLDLLDRKVCICGNARLLWLDVNNDEEGVWCVSLEQLVDLEIRCAQLGAGVVPSDQLLSGVDLLEHVVHALDVVVVQEPHGWVLLVLFKGNWQFVSLAGRNRTESLGLHTCEAVRHADVLAIVPAQKHTDYSPLGALEDGSVVVVDRGQQDEGSDSDVPCHKGQRLCCSGRHVQVEFVCSPVFYAW